MTQKERIDKLEREISDLRLLVEAYRAITMQKLPVAPMPYTPRPQQPWVSPNTFPAHPGAIRYQAAA
jgi:hypothetical protein